MSRRNIVVLGSTGSIGVSTLRVARKLNRQFNVVGLSAHTNIRMLTRQIDEFHPRYACTGSEKDALFLKRKYGRKLQVCFGNEGLAACASHRDVDTVLIAVVGSDGLFPLIAAIRSGKRIALANKESLVIAGGLIQRLMKRSRACLIPVDSEHSAIFQCLHGQDRSALSRLLITASGGPFFGRKMPLKNVTVSQALSHPRWSMGKKITIDSATMMNKGLEIIEARHLFNLPLEKIQVVIHPQSIVHSMVEFCDGAVVGLMSSPDMRLSIQYALTYPRRFPTGIKKMDLDVIGRLDFHKPDMRRFPCLALALDAAATGHSMPVAMNAADEVAVRLFLQGAITFIQIPALIEKIMKKHRVINDPGLQQIIAVDTWARKESYAAAGGRT